MSAVIYRPDGRMDALMAICCCQHPTASLCLMQSLTIWSASLDEREVCCNVRNRTSERRCSWSDGPGSWILSSLHCRSWICECRPAACGWSCWSPRRPPTQPRGQHVTPGGMRAEVQLRPNCSASHSSLFCVVESVQTWTHHHDPEHLHVAFGGECQKKIAVSEEKHVFSRCCFYIFFFHYSTSCQMSVAGWALNRKSFSTCSPQENNNSCY